MRSPRDLIPTSTVSVKQQLITLWYESYQMTHIIKTIGSDDVVSGGGYAGKLSSPLGGVR